MKRTMSLVILAAACTGVPAQRESEADANLRRVEEILRAEVRDLGDDVEFEFRNGGRSLVAEYRTRSFMVHGRVKNGRINPKPHERRGPSFNGFMLAVHIQDAGTVNQAMTPQTIREPYWTTDLFVREIAGTERQVYVALSRGSRTDQKELSRLRSALDQLDASHPRPIGKGAAASPQHDFNSLVGTLRVHPKFSYRYYLDGFGDGQRCGLFKAHDELKKIKPGTRVRVRGHLGSKFFSDPNDPLAAISPGWVIYMDVAHVETFNHAGN